MTVAYRFCDERPVDGTYVNAFRDLKDLREFANMQGHRGTMRFWKIEGSVEKDDGEKDGLLINVSSAKEVF